MTHSAPTPDPRETVHAYADQLRQYATHFAPRDWDYTRQHDIRTLTHVSLWFRIKDTVGYAVRDGVKRLRRKKSSTDRLFDEIKICVGWRAMVGAHWRHHNHLPDGVLDGGAVITHWEETGEYLQYVQPTVGALIADLMDAHPDLPEVRAVALEMKRINDRYGERVAAEPEDFGEVGA